MKTIGLIGGMSWESSVEYYRLINEEVKRRLGGLHSAKCILYSVDFEEIERCQREGNWKKAGKILAEVAVNLEKAGADFVILCTNTMHKVIEYIKKEITIPILHIADATVTEIKKAKISTVGLLATKYTMEQDFYKERLSAEGINILIPNEEERAVVNRVIFDELCIGKIETDSRNYFQNIIQSLVAQGAEGIILGCTEIGLLVKQENYEVPLFDTAIIHSIEAVNKALQS